MKKPPSGRQGRIDPALPSARAVIVGIVLSLTLLGGMVALDQALTTPAAPKGIISLELAGNLDKTNQILDSWPEPARIQAGISLGLDFFFLAAYAFTLSAACRWVAAYLPPGWNLWQRLGISLAYAQWLTASLDVVENLALIQILIGQGKSWHPILAAFCAWPKFGLAAGALLYIFMGGVVLIAMRFSRR